MKISSESSEVLGFPSVGLVCRGYYTNVRYCTYYKQSSPSMLLKYVASENHLNNSFTKSPRCVAVVLAIIL